MKKGSTWGVVFGWQSSKLAENVLPFVRIHFREFREGHVIHAETGAEETALDVAGIRTNPLVVVHERDLALQDVLRL